MSHAIELTQTAYVERFRSQHDHNETPVEADFVYTISDLHTDVRENEAWVDALQDHTQERAALIIAGDIATDLNLLEATLSKLSKLFIAVWYIVGNHELWLDSVSTTGNSVEKFFKILELCARLGIRTGPGKAAHNVTIVPLFGWWKFEFSQAEMRPALKRMDSKCKWPSSLGGASTSPGVASFFLRLNSRRCAQDYGDDVIISFSHFLPRVSLFYGTPYIGRVMGCDELGDQVENLLTRNTSAHKRIHVFGHSHLNIDRVIGKVRYVQHALGMPRERKTDYWGIFGAGSGPRVVWRSQEASYFYSNICDYVRLYFSTIRALVVGFVVQRTK